MQVMLINETPKSDEDFNVTDIDFNPEEEVTLESIHERNPLVSEITEKAKVEGASFEQKINEIVIDDTTSIFTEVMKTQPPLYKLDNQFKDTAKTIKLPQFFKKVDASELTEISLFEELNSEDQFLNSRPLKRVFRLEYLQSGFFCCTTLTCSLFWIWLFLAKKLSL